MRSFLWSSVPFAAAFIVIGCGSKSTTSGTTGAGGGTSCNLTEAQNTAFCSTGAPKVNCNQVTNQKSQVCGIPVAEPSTDIIRSSTVMEFAGNGPPQVSCFTPAGYPPAKGAPQNVTVTGLAKIFSSGCDSGGLKVTFYTVKRTSGSDNGMLDQPVGTPITTDAMCNTTGVAVTNANCMPSRYECKYSYAGVPTETELAIKTEGAPTWKPLIQYNIYIKNSAVTGGMWNYDVRALAAADYTAIPTAAIGGPVDPGKGVIAGEVHDCGDVRLVNAVVGTPGAKTIYFGSNEEAPLPDLSADSTSTLGLYVAFNIPPGPISVASMGKLSGMDVALGLEQVYIYPDTVTTVTFNGLQPYQLPAGGG